MQRLTKEQSIILTGFTGKLLCRFDEFHEDLEKRIGRPVWSHELASEELWDTISGLYKDDFMAIVPEDML